MDGDKHFGVLKVCGSSQTLCVLCSLCVTVGCTWWWRRGYFQAHPVFTSAVCTNNALTEIAWVALFKYCLCAGLAQPDEDDYGYVSQEASAFYDKLMEKYTSTPSDKPKSSKKSLLKSSAADLINTKVC